MEDACAAARNGQLAFFQETDKSKLQQLLEKYDSDGRTLLHNTVTSKNVGLVNYILGFSPEVNTEDDEGWSPLHTAASIGSEAIVSLLLGCGARVDPRNSSGCTPLHYAVSKGHVAVAERLLDAGGRFPDGRGQIWRHLPAQGGSKGPQPTGGPPPPARRPCGRRGQGGADGAAPGGQHGRQAHGGAPPGEGGRPRG
uniref:26S proteasome non-ATPase regulatory subunit 10 n=1 Tax=Tetraselmis sp. GSL018 TaxID=582737 RepID=A0A061RNW2_9CHLO